jgi:hypothetical protein
MSSVHFLSSSSLEVAEIYLYVFFQLCVAPMLDSVRFSSEPVSLMSEKVVF